MSASIRHRRRASTYLIVLGGSMLVTVIGLSAVLATRAERRTNEGLSDFMQARMLAHSAIEMGFFAIGNDANWRSAPPTGPWDTKNLLIGDGTYSLQMIDHVDGDLTNSDLDPVLLRGTGQVGDAQYILQVQLNALQPAVGALSRSLHAASDLQFNNAVVTGDQLISCNNAVTAISSTIDVDVEAVSTITGVTFKKSTSSGAAAQSLPDASGVFDYYINNGSTISLFSIPLINGMRTIENALIAPTTTPYSTTNPNGIYVIDCYGLPLQIHQSRIVGTLVLLNVGDGSAIYDSILWEPAIANFPALLVQGSINLIYTADPLSEADTGTNFNPVGTPYGGAEDTDTTDSYSSSIKGIIYTTADVLDDTSVILTGYAKAVNVTLDGALVVGNSLNMTAGTMDLHYDSTYTGNPPPGFTEPVRMLIAPGSWQRITN